jgi:hypothetical protein
MGGKRRVKGSNPLEKSPLARNPEKGYEWDIDRGKGRETP